MEFAQAEVFSAGLKTAPHTRSYMGSQAGPHAGSDAGLRAVPQMPTLPTKLCADSHPNDPASTACRVCERPFDPASEIIAMTPSVVARLLLEDGSAIDVDNRLLIGRSPITDQPLDTLTVAGRQVSRHHALLETRGWELFIRDYESTNGTFLTRRGERGRRRVPSDESILVRIGDSIHFGSRQALVVQPKAD